MKTLPEMYVSENKKELVKCSISLKDSLTLRDGTFFSTVLLTPLENWLDFHENFITDISLDNKVSVKY